MKMVSDDGKIYGFGAGRTDFENTPVQAVWRTGRLFSENINVHKITLWAKLSIGAKSRFACPATDIRRS